MQTILYPLLLLGSLSLVCLLGSLNPCIKHLSDEAKVFALDDLREKGEKINLISELAIRRAKIIFNIVDRLSGRCTVGKNAISLGKIPPIS